VLEQAELADQLPYGTVVVGERHFWDDAVLNLRTWSELINFGADPDERVGRFMESIHLIERLLDSDRFDHDGQHFQFEDGFVAPGPVQSPRPPLVGGGSADTAIKRAAFRCDGVTAAITAPNQLERDVDLLRCAGRGREGSRRRPRRDVRRRLLRRDDRGGVRRRRSVPC
jgi:alkanesulfonate monooxygenase SsuD/methylene tetrahydromethanopterin reductase-like flavin-dependent oxidoreductase (luciferase family)